MTENANSKTKDKSFLTEGNVLKALLIIALPIILSNLLQNVLELVDVYFVGQLGDIAVAACTTGASIVMLLMVLIFGINTATAAFASRAYGSGQMNRIPVILGHALYLTMGLSLIIAIVGIFFTEDLYHILGCDEQETAMGVIFLQPVLICIFIMVLLMVLTTIMQSTGDSKTPMFVMIVINLINILLNPALINGYGFFPQMGVAGSAYASIISRSLGVILLILAMYLLPSKRNSQVKFPKKWTFEPRLLRDISLIGLPSAVQSSLRCIAFVCMTAIITIFGGTAAMAAYGLCVRLDAIGFILILGLCTGTAVMVGQNLGAGKPERAMSAAKYAIVLNTSFMIILGLIYFFFACNIMQAFGATGDWHEIGESFLRIVPLSYFAIGMGMTMGFAMNGAGVTYPGMIGALVGQLLVQVGGSFLVAGVFHMDITCVWIVVFISAFFTVGVDAWFFLRKKWLHKNLNISS